MKELKCQHLNHKQKCYGENIYSKVGNDKRLALLDMVKLQGKSLKVSASMLNINYSTAKTILRVYRIENRILKKTPYQKKPKQIFITGHVSREVKQDKNSNSIEKQKFNVIGCKEDSATGGSKNELDNNHSTKLNNSGSNFYNHNENTHQEIFKNSRDFLSQYKTIVFSLRTCVNEVLHNEIAIKKICSLFQILYNNSVPCIGNLVHRPVPINYSNFHPKQLFGNNLC